MKKLSKILVLILSLALAVGATVLVASAGSDAEAPFYVNGEAWGDESKTLADAIAAANGGVVKLGSDVNLTETVTVAANTGVRIDLGGKTLSSSASPMFSVSTGASFELRGKGTIAPSATIISADNAASIKINAYGSGIVIDDNTNTAKTFFALGSTDSTYVSGKITINPKYHLASYLFRVGGTKTEVEADAALFTVEGAEIVLNLPEEKAQFAEAGIWFVDMHDGSKLRVNRSSLSLAHANFVNAATGTSERITVTKTNRGEGVMGTKIVAAAAETINFTKWVDIDDSEIRAYEGGYTRLNHSSGWGKLFAITAASIEVRIDNTTLEGGGRSISAEEDYTNSRVGGNKFYFTNVDYSSYNLTYSSCWVIGGNISIDWNGGKINHTNAQYSKQITIDIPKATETDSDTSPFGNLAKAAIMETLEVTELPAGFENWYAKTASGKYEYYTSSISTTTGQLTYRGWYYSEVNNTWYGQRFSNVYLNGVALPGEHSDLDSRNASIGQLVGTHYQNVKVITDAAPVKYSHAYLSTAYTGDHIQIEKTSAFNPTTSEQTVDFYSAAFADRFGNYEVVYSDGASNGYVRAYVDKTNYKGATTTSPYLESFLRTGSSYAPLQGKTYVVQEFDVSTDNGAYLEGHAYLFARNAVNTITAKENNGVNISTGNYLPLLFKIQPNGSITDIAGTGSGSSVTLPTDGSWSRFSFIYEIKSETSNTSVTTGEYTSTYTQVKYDLNVHIYIDGVWLTSVYKELFLHSSKANAQILDSVRFNLFNTYNASGVGKDSSLCMDNGRLSYYTKANAELAALCADPSKGISSNSAELMIMERNVDKAAIAVDGVLYDSMDKAFAAIENGSIVKLYDNIDTVVEVNKSFTIITNGYSDKGFKSETHKIVREDGKIHAVAADSDEIKSIAFVNADVTPSVNENYVAAVGTTVVPTTDFASIEPSEELGFFIGWTLVSGKNTLVVPEFYQGSAIAIYGEAAVLRWYDAAGKLIKTVFTVPGEGVKPTLPASFNYDEIYATGNGWYDLKIIGWTDALATEIKDAGSYDLRPDVAPIAPTDGLGVRGILINVSANVDFDLNVYVPQDRPDAVTRVVLLNQNGAVVSYKRALNESGAEYRDENGDYVHDPVSVKGKIYDKYIDPYGVADASIRTYKLSYTVMGTTITQEIKYGLPYYASAVMNSETSESITEDAKDLVMYMVNYSTTIVKHLGDIDDQGYAIYKGLMAQYGDRITALRDAEYFVTDEKILVDIANLNYKSSKYIDSASFYFNTSEPVFVFKYSDAAEAEGLQRPNSNNFVGWSSDVFAYFMFENEPNSRPTRIYAYRGTMENGTLLGYNDPTWNSSEDNSYYILGSSFRHYENKSLYWSKHSIYNILEPVYVIVQRNDVAETTDVNEKLYEKSSYSFAAYVNSLVTEYNAIVNAIEAETDAVALSELNAKAGEYETAIELALALYAYAEAADRYVVR